MRLTFKRFPFLFQITCMKLRKAYGVRSTSNILLFDVDEQKTFFEAFHWFCKHYPLSLVIQYLTKHGYHVIVVSPFKRTFQQQATVLVNNPFVDMKWVSIGLKRGYWFLESDVPIPQARYMEIERNA